MDASTRRTEDAQPQTSEIPEPPRLRRPDRRQTLLEPVNLDERLPADHRARVVWAFVCRLDLSKFEEPLVNRGSTPGRSAIDPALAVLPELEAIKQNRTGKPSRKNEARVSSTDCEARRMKFPGGGDSPGVQCAVWHGRWQSGDRGGRRG